MTKQLTILALSGSLREGSSHHAILTYLAGTTPHQVLIYNGIEELPNFNPAKDTEPAPAAVSKFREALSAADGVLICTPEYAYGIPGSLKNALDWTVSSGNLVDKPTAVITASGLGEHAHASLLLVLNALTARVVTNGTLLIPWIRSKMNAENEITDEATAQDMQNVLSALIAAIEAG